MDKYGVHFCLVSEQPLPNLIPALDPDVRPDMVVLLVTSDMQAKATTLARTLKSLGCRVEERRIPAYQIEKLQESLYEMLAEYEDMNPALNATGGTKVMAMGAYECFRDNNKPVFYVDTHNKTYIRLYPAPQTRELESRIKVKHYLAAYGFELVSSGGKQVPQEHKQVGRFLVENAHRLGEALKKMNYLASEAKNSLSTFAQESILKSQGFDELLESFKKAGLMDQSGGRIVFADESARFFVNGGWLEEYVLAVCNELKGGKQLTDHERGAEVLTPDHVRNEFDIVFTAHNKLHIIECKTVGNLGGNESRAADVVYKLDTLKRHAGGLFGKAMLVSYHEVNKADRERARSYNMEIVEGRQLGNLRDIIINWSRK